MKIKVTDKIKSINFGSLSLGDVVRHEDKFCMAVASLSAGNAIVLETGRFVTIPANVIVGYYPDAFLVTGKVKS